MNLKIYNFPIKTLESIDAKKCLKDARKVQ